MGFETLVKKINFVRNFTNNLDQKTIDEYKVSTDKSWLIINAKILFLHICTFQCALRNGYEKTDSFLMDLEKALLERFLYVLFTLKESKPLEHSYNI